jgi:phosphonate transport system substrate-binding protein
VQLAERVFALKHDNVVTMIYQGQVDAGATYYSPPSENGEIRDARARVMTQFPDVVEKIKIIALTDDIPNDPVVIRKDVPAPIRDKIVNALMKYVETEEGKKVLADIYGIDGFVKTNDQDYDVLRQMIETTGVDASSLLEE